MLYKINKSIFYMAIGDRIKEVISSKGLNYRSLSQLIPYSDVQVRRICLNESIPKVDFIQHLCNIFPDLDANWLITGKKGNISSHKISEDEIEQISIKVFDNWDLLMKDRLFKANFESKAASWALKIKNQQPE